MRPSTRLVIAKFYLCFFHPRPSSYPIQCTRQCTITTTTTLTVTFAPVLLGSAVGGSATSPSTKYEITLAASSSLVDAIQLLSSDFVPTWNLSIYYKLQTVSATNHHSVLTMWSSQCQTKKGTLLINEHLPNLRLLAIYPVTIAS